MTNNKDDESDKTFLLIPTARQVDAFGLFAQYPVDGRCQAMRAFVASYGRQYLSRTAGSYYCDSELIQNTVRRHASLTLTKANEKDIVVDWIVDSTPVKDQLVSLHFNGKSIRELNAPNIGRWTQELVDLSPSLRKFIGDKTNPNPTLRDRAYRDTMQDLLSERRPVLQPYRRTLKSSEAWLVVKADRRNPSVSEVSGPLLDLGLILNVLLEHREGGTADSE